MAALASTDAERAHAAIPRSAALFVSLRRPAEALAMLDTVTSAISDDAAAPELAALLHGN